MRVLVLSDIHANLAALQAVIADAGPIDAAWCLGDVVGYGPDPNECIEALQSLPNLVCLLGNHDAAAIGNLDLDSFNYEARRSIEWIRSRLSTTNKVFLANLPETCVIGHVTLAHGSPRNPVWEYLLETISAAENFYFFDTPYCFVGHTHLPLIYYPHPEYSGRVERRLLRPDQPVALNGRAILNPGSAGQPRDHDPRAAYAIFDSDSMTWEPRRIVYDVAAVQQRILAAGLPFRHAQRLEDGW